MWAPAKHEQWSGRLGVALVLGALHCAAPLPATSVLEIPRGVPAPPTAPGAEPSPGGEPPVFAPDPVATPPLEVVRSGPHWRGAGRAFDGTLRGDWDTSSALLVVYNRSWQSAIGRLLDYAHEDLPVYVLATPIDARSASFHRWFASVPFAGLVSIALDTPWIRDYGPLEVQSERGISWLDLIYAPEDRPLDDAVPGLLSEVFETPHQSEQFQLEGGGIISSGDGLCGITETSLEELGLVTADAETWEHFLETVGCRTLARLPQLPLESTGHADMLAQFLSPTQVAIAVPTAESAPEVAEALRGVRRALVQAADAHGRQLEFVELPMANREDHYYSYVNGLRTPSHYFVPSYSFVDPALEEEAHQRLARALQGVQVVGVDSDEMIENGGAIHCVTLGLKHPLLPRAHRPPGRVASAGKLGLHRRQH
jgi:agmatine/peptidylarginine deiminase